MHTPSDTSCSSPVSRCPSGMRRSFQADFVLLLRALRADAGDAHQSAPSSSGGGLQNAPCGGDDSKRRQTPPPPLHTHTHTHTRHGRFSCCPVSAGNRFKSARRRRREGGRGESAPIDCDGAVLSQHANALGCARRVAGADSDGGRRTQTGNYGEVSVARWGTLCTTSSLGQSAYSDRTSGRVIISYCFC